MNKFDLYITFIFMIKIGFSLLSIAHLYLVFKGNSGSEFDKKIEYWKNRLEFIFIILMSVILIYVFNPRDDKILLVDTEMKVLLFIFGIILLITADWENFVKEAKWCKLVQKVMN